MARAGDRAPIFAQPARAAPYLRSIHPVSAMRGQRPRSTGSSPAVGGIVRSVRTLFIAAVSLGGLSACVGTDPHASLRGGSGGALAATAAPVVPDPVEPTPRLTAVMPGELLLQPQRELAGTNPGAVLTHSQGRLARLPQSSVASASSRPRTGTYAARLEDAPRRAPVRAAGLPTSPLHAARLAAADASAGTPVTASALTPLADVEARAEIEQRAQASRDRRFDAQVRRASSLVCSGCLSSPSRGSAWAGRTAVDADE